MMKRSIAWVIVCILPFLGMAGCKGEEETPKPAVQQQESSTPPKETPATAPAIGQEAAPVPPAAQPPSNQPPRIVSARILPAPAYSDQDLTVELQAEDIEGDPITYAYQWMSAKEGEPLSALKDLEGEISASLGRDKFTRGEVLVVKITPSDWYAAGPLFQTNPTIINNCPPRIVSDPPDALAKTNFYSYQVQAADPDNDTVTFSLGEGAPDGMTIDSQTGLLAWTLSPEQSGSFSFTIKGDDGRQGICTQRVNLALETKPSGPTATQ
jgi:hypothetical protein